MNDETLQHFDEMESVVQKANCGVGRFDFHADPEVRFVAMEFPHFVRQGLL